MKEKHTREMTARESSTSYNTKENTVITRNPTQMDQRAQKGKGGFAAVFADITT